VVSVTDPSGRISRFSRQEPLLFYQVAPQLQQRKYDFTFHVCHLCATTVNVHSSSSLYCKSLHVRPNWPSSRVKDVMLKESVVLPFFSNCFRHDTDMRTGKGEQQISSALQLVHMLMAN
jgi:hypothetical protein